MYHYSILKPTAPKQKLEDENLLASGVVRAPCAGGARLSAPLPIPRGDAAVNHVRYLSCFICTLKMLSLYLSGQNCLLFTFFVLLLCLLFGENHMISHKMLQFLYHC